MAMPDDEITAAHDDVVRTRARMADTVAQIEARVTGQMDAVKTKLDVVQMIRDNPWTALALATGIGAAIGASGTDARAASAAAAGAKQAAAKAREAAAAAVEAAKAAPGKAQSGAQAASRSVRDHLDELAAAAVLGIIERLREEDGSTVTGASRNPGTAAGTTPSGTSGTA